MTALVAELSKLVSSRATVGTALAGVLVPAALAALNASQIRSAWDAGRPETVTPDLAPIGLQEPMVAVAACAAIGVLAVGAEYRSVAADHGGGRQSTTTALAIPSRRLAFLAKLVATTLAVALVAGLACGLALLTAHQFLGPYAVDLDPARWGRAAQGWVYVVLSGLLGLGLTVLLRNGLVPLIYLVANSTIVSPTFLLTRVADWAWYLPDTSGMALVQVGGEADPGRPSALVGGVTMAAWVTALLAVAAIVHARRDA